jgi:hypothetical protein
VIFAVPDHFFDFFYVWSHEFAFLQTGLWLSPILVLINDEEFVHKLNSVLLFRGRLLCRVYAASNYGRGIDCSSTIPTFSIQW